MGQKRGDYYASPIIILLCGVTISSYTGNFRRGFNGLTIKLLKFIALPLQLTITFTLLIFSAYQTVLATLNYEKTMIKFAHGYKVTKELDEYSKGRRSVNYILRSTRLYSSNSNYVHQDKITFCTGRDNAIQRLPDCLRANNVEKIALSSENRHKIKDDLSQCKEEETFFVGRNPFSSKKLVITSVQLQEAGKKLVLRDLKYGINLPNVLFKKYQ